MTEAQKEYHRNWNAKNKDKVSKKNKKWKTKNRDYCRKYDKEHYYKDSERSKLKNHKNKLKYNYGITIEDYENLSKKQNHKCAICGKKCASGRRLAIDHDHKTGKIRGLLCMKHNRGLGMFNDSYKLLKSAINYLKKKD